MNAPALPAAVAAAAFQIAAIAAFAPSTTRTQERRRRRFPAASWRPQGNESVLKFLGIDDEKVREQIIGERKNALAAARMKAKLAKASPLVKTKGKLKWPFPLKGGKKKAGKK